MHATLNAIFQRRAIREFDPIEIAPSLRNELLEAARLAPSSFNSQPYRLFWVSSCDSLRTVAKFCFGQPPAQTASVLLVAVADRGHWRVAFHHPRSARVDACVRLFGPENRRVRT